MADNEVKIKVSTETETEELEEVDALVDEIRDKSTIPVGVDVDDSSVTDADANVKQLNEDLDETDSKNVSPEVDTTGVDELSNKASEASSSLDNLTTAAAGLGVTAGVEQMVTTADRINTSWNQLELTFGSVSDNMKSDISEVSNATGRSGGTIRGYFNDMGIAGVTNSELISSSFEALAGKAYQTGNDIESMESKMQTMVLSGNASSRMLKTLGLSAEDLGNAMGVSADQVSKAFKNLTPEERLTAITKAMGDGKQANEMYKNSYQGLKTQAETAMAGLMGAVGQAILPVVIPALKGAAEFVKGLTDAFKNLPGPVQGVIGGVLGFAGIAVTAIGVLGTLGSVFKTVKGGLEALNLVTKLSKVYTEAAALAQWALNIAMDANPVMLVVLAIIALVAILGYLYFNNEQVREAIDSLGQSLMAVGQAIYTGVAGALQWLSDQFQAFTDQLGLNTDNWGEAILGFLAFLPQLPLLVGQVLVDTIAQSLGFGSNFTSNMINSAVDSVNGFISAIVNFPGMVWDILVNGVNSANQFANSFIQSIVSGATGAVNGFISAIAGFPAWVWNILVNAYNRAVQFASNFISSLVNGAINAVNGFSNAVQGIPRAVQACLDWAYNLIMNHPIVQALKWLGEQAAWAFSVLGLGQSSPGKIVKALRNELNWASEAVSDSSLVRDVAGLGNMIVDAFGSPRLNIGLDSLISELGIVFGLLENLQTYEIDLELKDNISSVFDDLNNQTIDINAEVSEFEMGNGLLVDRAGDIGVTGSGGDFIVNVYGDVDNDKRVKQIVDTIKEELYWDNTRAGRIV